MTGGNFCFHDNYSNRITSPAVFEKKSDLSTYRSSSILDFLRLFSVTSQSLSYTSPSALISAPDDIADGIIRRKCSDRDERGLSKISTKNS